MGWRLGLSAPYFPHYNNTPPKNIFTIAPQKMHPEIMKTTVLFNYLYIVSPVVEDNSIKNRQQKDLGAIPFKTYRVYQKTPS
jgi:hypothetical protein